MIGLMLRREIRRHRVSFVVWAALLVLGTVFRMAESPAFADKYADDEAAPSEFSTTEVDAFGLAGLPLTEVTGYFGGRIFSLLLLVSIYLVMLAPASSAARRRTGPSSSSWSSRSPGSDLESLVAKGGGRRAEYERRLRERFGLEIADELRRTVRPVGFSDFRLVHTCHHDPAEPPLAVPVTAFHRVRPARAGAARADHRGAGRTGRRTRPG